LCFLVLRLMTRRVVCPTFFLPCSSYQHFFIEYSLYRRRYCNPFQFAWFISVGVIRLRCISDLESLDAKTEPRHSQSCSSRIALLVTCHPDSVGDENLRYLKYVDTHRSRYLALLMLLHSCSRCIHAASAYPLPRGLASTKRFYHHTLHHNCDLGFWTCSRWRYPPRGATMSFSHTRDSDVTFQEQRVLG
jgi:hypothetical protein